MSNLTIQICYEDAYIIAVNKPNNVLVHHSKMANNKWDEFSLVQLLRQQFNGTYYPIHRLDRKTSGIILLAKNKAFISNFQDLFQTDKIEKTYYGIVRGHINDEICIDTPVKGRDALVYKDALTYCTPIINSVLEVAVHPYENSRYSLVKLAPKTGRLHQLRIHMNKISHPLIGDPKYGDRFHNRMFEEQFRCAKLFLHAHLIKFNHPFLNEEITIQAPFFKDWYTIAVPLNFTLPK